MSEAEKDVALLTDDKTGLHNERAYNESDRLAYQSFFDIDNFKEINDLYTYDGADMILEAFGNSMLSAAKEFNVTAVKPYRLHGDEFIVESNSEIALKLFSERVRNELNDKHVTIELPGGETKTATNIGASYGIAKTKEQAESNLKADKKARAREGLRTEREREPGGLPEAEPGQQDREGVITPAEEITAEADKAAASPENNKSAPTKEQIDAESYAKGYPVIQGLGIAIENPAGSKRKPMWPAMAAHYGDLVGYIGADGDAIDVFVKPDVDIADDNPVFIINQYVKGKFDEHKTMMGFPDEASARKSYLNSYTKGWDGLNSIYELSIDDFKTWLESGDTKVEYSPGKEAEKVAPAEPAADLAPESPAGIPEDLMIDVDIGGGETANVVAKDVLADVDGRITAYKTLLDCL